MRSRPFAYIFVSNLWEVGEAMARTIRNAKLDTRSARAKLPAQKSAYWVSISRGFTVGYRKGAKGCLLYTSPSPRDS